MSKHWTWFDNYDITEAYDAAKRYLFEEYNDDGEWESEDDIPNNEIWRQVSDDEQIYWEDAEYSISKCIENRKFLVMGTCGLWTGPARAGAIIESFRELSRAWKDCDYIKLSEENGHFYIECSHHDGTNNFELKELTPRGKEFLCRHEDDMYEEELHTKLWKNNHYTKLPRFGERLGYYGAVK